VEVFKKNMSRTNKDKPVEFGGKFTSKNLGKRIKNEMKHHRNRLNKLVSQPDPSWINKFLADEWNWS
jgi:hypothetical protein